MPTEPRVVHFTLADRSRMTLIEHARACAIANVAPHEADELFRGIIEKRSSGPDFLRGVEYIHAMALQIVRREEPSLELADALGWDLRVIDAAPAEVAAIEAEAAVTVNAALLTGLPPAEAGELTLAQAARYERVASERQQAMRRELATGRRRR